MRTLILSCLIGAAFPADAASLRPTTVLHGPIVRLRDLFDDPGAEANRVLGPGPAPGGRIVVDAPQLRAIARQFDVDWRPASSADRAVLERPGQSMNRDDALAAVRAALVAAGASPDCVVELSGFSAPLVPLGTMPRTVVSQLDYDAKLSRFSALLSVAGDGMEPTILRVSGMVREMVELPVATARLSAGTILGQDDVHMARVSAGSVRGEAVRAMDQIIGMQLTHGVQPEQPLLLADLTPPIMVRRGALIRVRLESAGLFVTGQAVALQAGSAGERIKVLNPASRTTVEGIVIGPNLVGVTPTASPEAAAARGEDVRRR
jgi:flagella basal body P-ring formation protein FlgA